MRAFFDAYIVILLGGLAICQAGPTSVQEPDLATSIRLRYAVLDSRADVLPCSRITVEGRDVTVAKALQAFSEAQSHPEYVQAIAAHLNFGPDTKLGNDERVLIGCEYRKLQEMRLVPWGDKYRVEKSSEVQFAGDGESAARDGWMAVDLQGNVTSMGWGTLPVVVSPPLSEIAAKPPVTEAKIQISRIEFPELRYRVVDYFAAVPLCSSTRFQAREIAAFPEIQQDTALFVLILKHLNLAAGKQFSDREKLLVYKEYEKLNGMKLDFLVTKYQFMYGGRVGLMDQRGGIAVLKTLLFRGCPKL